MERTEEVPLISNQICIIVYRLLAKTPRLHQNLRGRAEMAKSRPILAVQISDVTFANAPTIPTIIASKNLLALETSVIATKMMMWNEWTLGISPIR